MLQKSKTVPFRNNMKAKTDAQIADDLRTAIGAVAALMNEAKARNIAVVFNINEIEIMDRDGKPTGKVFKEIIDIKRIEQL